MIDEKKVLKELEEIRSRFTPSSPEEKLLSTFQIYIKGQKRIEAEEILLLNRATKLTTMILSEAGILQVESRE